ncbi:hypothetical protein EYF80_019271 [Liparis tanakae]|uniref:Uncharacterized protein n=1 Tax=Liparis tanakae TaxID=230148 RepID=A0A4Z2HXE3_9TELE|nr:hypothetical protein EYF80_019271 [Liparis tanakae]
MASAGMDLEKPRPLQVSVGVWTSSCPPLISSVRGETWWSMRVQRYIYMSVLTLLGETQLLQQHVEPVVGQPAAGQRGFRGHLGYLGRLTGIQPEEQTAGLVKTGDVPLQTFHHR